MRIPIVVQALKCDKHRADEDDEVKEKYRRLEFHLVELKGEEGEEGDSIELHRDWLPSLLSRTGPAPMFASGQSIFIVSGKDSKVEEEPPPGRHLHLNGGAKIHIHNHQNNNLEWDSVPNSNNYALFVCVFLLGKFYNFPTWTICPQVFDPNCVVGGGERHWKFLSLPHHLDSNSPLSIPVVPDPSNRRILVHTSSTLLAFYPDEEADTSDADVVRVEGGKWECLDSNFFIWADVVALAADDHLLFLHEFSKHRTSSLLVYDLATKTWLDVVWSTPFLGDLRVTDFQFDALFSLPNQFMCFFHHQPSEPNYSIHFLKFSAKRCPDRPRALILTPVSLHSKTLFNTKTVSTILPLC